MFTLGMVNVGGFNEAPTGRRGLVLVGWLQAAGALYRRPVEFIFIRQFARERVRQPRQTVTFSTTKRNTLLKVGTTGTLFCFTLHQRQLRSPSPRRHSKGMSMFSYLSNISIHSTLAVSIRMRPF